MNSSQIIDFVIPLSYVSREPLTLKTGSTLECENSSPKRAIRCRTFAKNSCPTSPCCGERALARDAPGSPGEGDLANHHPSNFIFKFSIDNVESGRLVKVKSKNLYSGELASRRFRQGQAVLGPGVRVLWKSSFSGCSDNSLDRTSRTSPCDGVPW